MGEPGEANLHLSSYASLCALVCCSACSGLTFNERSPSNDNFIGDVPDLDAGQIALGSIAVHLDSNTAVLMRAESRNDGTSQQIFTVDVENSRVSAPLNIRGEEDVRVTFPANDYLLFTEKFGRDTLRRVDLETNAVLQQRDFPVRFHGTRTSASRHWVAVADNSSGAPNTHIIDTNDLSSTILPTNGDWLEATWLRTRDEFVVIEFFNAYTDRAYARVLSWTMTKLVESNFVMTDEGYFPDPEIDMRIDNVQEDGFFSYTWIGVSPNDSQIVIPVHYRISESQSDERWIVIDTATHDLRWVEAPVAPVGFTPDGSTIVAQDTTYVDEEVHGALLLVDATTLEKGHIPLPIVSAPTFFVSHAGNLVVAAPSWPLETAPLVLVDLDTEEVAQLEGGPRALGEFAVAPSTQELWLLEYPLLENTKLFRVNMMDATWEQMSLSFDPSHINILPDGRHLLLTAKFGDSLHVYDTVEERLSNTIAIR